MSNIRVARRGATPSPSGFDGGTLAPGRRMLRCTLACILPSSSRSLAVAKDEDRGRFTGNRRPLNSQEGSIGRAQLPCCPRLRRMILGKSETVQNATRYQRLCFYLYEVPPSRVARQMIGPRKHLDDESLDVIDTAEIESWVPRDLLKTCSSVKPVSDLDCQRLALLRRTCRFVTHRSAARRCFARLLADADECGQVKKYTRWRILGRTPGRRFRHAGVASCTPSLTDSHLDAGRCCERESYALATPSGRLGIRPRLPPRIRQPRCGLHCCDHLAAKQMLGEGSSS